MQGQHLPEFNQFEYKARAPWPVSPSHNQIDWIESIDIMRYWLESSVGPHLAHWAWSTDAQQKAWECCVAFRWDRDRLLFLIKWG